MAIVVHVSSFTDMQESFDFRHWGLVPIIVLVMITLDPAIGRA
jgi:hypothetical protein